MNIRTPPLMDKASFFAWIERQERKFELANGIPVMMSYVTRHHARICTNVVVALSSRLDRSRFDITQGDFAVETGERSIRYADVMVEPFDPAGSARSTERALLLVEVLSPTTMHIDFHDKLDEYRGLPTLGTYLIAAQDEARIWVWTRDGGTWPQEPQILSGTDGVVDVPVLGIDLPLGEMYRGIARPA